MSVVLEPTSVIEVNLGIQDGGPAHAFLTETCANHMDKYVPYREGGLAYDNMKVEIDKVIYESPYAHYMYEGQVMGPSFPIFENGYLVGWRSRKNQPKHYTGKSIQYNTSAGHEYAGPYWDERMKTAEIDEVIQEVQDFINRGGKQ